MATNKKIQNLIRAFVKNISADKTQPKNTNTTYGNVVTRDGTKQVLLDGSTEPTACMFNVEADEGDRVVCSVQNHSWSVDSNVTKPASSPTTAKGRSDVESIIDEHVISLSGIDVYYQTEQPTEPSGGFKDGDTWYKLDANGYAIGLYVWENDDWVSTKFDGGDILRANSVTSNEIAVNSLSAISAYLGDVSGGSIDIGDGRFKVYSNGDLMVSNDSGASLNVLSNGFSIQNKTTLITELGINYEAYTYYEKGEYTYEHFRVAPTWRPNTYYERDPFTDKYELLTEQPDDWFAEDGSETYYVRFPDPYFPDDPTVGIYRPAEAPPKWQQNTYYEKDPENLTYSLLTEQPSDWDINFYEKYYIYDDEKSTYELIPAIPEWQQNTYYVKNLVNLTYSLLTVQPVDWTERYWSYYIRLGEREIDHDRGADGVERINTFSLAPDRIFYTNQHWAEIGQPDKDALLIFDEHGFQSYVTKDRTETSFKISEIDIEDDGVRITRRCGVRSTKDATVDIEATTIETTPPTLYKRTTEGVNIDAPRIHTSGVYVSYRADGGFTHIHGTSGNKITFGIGSDGTNRGIYDDTKSGWLMYRGSGTEIFFGGGLRPGTTASYALGDAGHIWYNLYTEAIRLYRNTAYYFGFGGTPSANRTITFQNASGTVAFTSSDARLKRNIENTELSGLDMMNSIKIRQFDWLDDETAGYNKGRHQTIGFVADELEELDPFFIVNGSGGEDDDGNINPKCVDTFYMLGYMAKAIQELSAKVDELSK